MVIDTIIILLLIAIGIFGGIILWRAASAKAYDPNHVDLSSNFDPQHDHFSKQHAEKRLKAAARNKAPLNRKSTTRSAAAYDQTESLAHLIPPKESETVIKQPVVETPAPSAAAVTERRSEDRRSNRDRRSVDRRTQPA